MGRGIIMGKRTLKFSKESVESEGVVTKVSTEASLNKGRRMELERAMDSFCSKIRGLFDSYPVEGIAKRAEDDVDDSNLGKGIAALRYRVNAQRRFSKMAYDASSIASELAKLLDALGEDCAVSCLDALAESRRLSE